MARFSTERDRNEVRRRLDLVQRARGMPAIVPHKNFITVRFRLDGSEMPDDDDSFDFITLQEFVKFFKAKIFWKAENTPEDADFVFQIQIDEVDKGAQILKTDIEEEGDEFLVVTFSPILYRADQKLSLKVISSQEIEQMDFRLVGQEA